MANRQQRRGRKENYERTKVEYNEACDKSCLPIKTYSFSNEGGGGDDL